MEQLLSFKPDARITILKCKLCHLEGVDEQCYQMVLSWNHGKYETEDGIKYNDFIESWGKTVDDCVNQLKKDLNI